MSITVRVPATTANIGPGFDCLGAALTLYNEFSFQLTDGPMPLQITVDGIQSEKVSCDATNLVYQAFTQVFAQIDQPVPAIALHINMGIPLARGLGSSATAIVGGLVGANVIAGKPLSTSQLATIATTIEGHPDNVVPALFGGARISATGLDQTWEVAELTWHEHITPVIAIPDFELSTAAARAVLPAQYSRADAVFNVAHLGLLLQGLATNNADWLKAALQDKIHQPFRQSLIVGYEDLYQAAIAAGAYGMVISGAGPTLLALCPTTAAPTVRSAMLNAWQSLNVPATAMVLGLDRQGTMVRIANCLEIEPIESSTEQVE